MRLVLVETLYLSTIKMEMQFRKSYNDMGRILRDLRPNIVPDFFIMMLSGQIKITLFWYMFKHLSIKVFDILGSN